MEHLLHALNDVMGFQGFPVVFENLLIHLDARLGTNVAGQLAGEVMFDGDLTLAAL
jgi:hypothetical protein